jgi:ABC-type bacteriocin/lantibiotic exporter with double-glycine peptidase domain
MAKLALSDIALETKRFRQSKARCGPATLKIVASYFGMNVSEARAAAMCRTSSVSGTTGKNLVAGARKLGFTARIIDGATFRIMAMWLRKGVPLIVDWMSIGRRGTVRAATGHYSVVSGLTENEIILEDPAIGRKRRLSRQLFMSLWYDFKYLSPRKSEDLVMRRMIVIAPPHLLDGKNRDPRLKTLTF